VSICLRNVSEKCEWKEKATSLLGKLEVMVKDMTGKILIKNGQLVKGGVNLLSLY
jgi:hypothetical protein